MAAAGGVGGTGGPVRSLKAPQVATLLGTWRGADSAGRSVPLHQALAQRITALLLDGRIGVGARLPAERALSEALAVSRTTVAGAYALLRESGFCESRRGSGSYTALPGGVGAHSAGGWHAGTGGSDGAGPDDGADPAGLIDLMVAAPLVRLPELQTALRGAAEQLPRFVDTGGLAPYGLPALRQAVAADYTARGLPTEPGQILVTNGAQGAITLISRLLLRPGDRVVVEAPSYPNALDSFRAAQARLVPVPVPAPEPEPGAASPAETHADAPDNALEETLTQLRPRLVYSIPFFQNPTGRVMDPERQAALARAARRAGSWVLADETLIDTALDRPVPSPFGVAVRPADAEAVLACGSLAKSFWGGLRIGWVRGPARMVHELAAARAAADLASPVLDQLAAVEVLAGRRPGTGGAGGTLAEQTLARHRERWLEQRAALVEAVREAFPQWTFRVPEGGLCLWIRMDREEAGALTYRARTHGLLLHAGPRFGADPGTFERYIRLPYTQPAPVLGEAVRRLALAARVPGPRRPGDHRADLVA